MQKIENKELFVHRLFSRIAGKYDYLNDLMTLFLHRAWKRSLVKHAAQGLQDLKSARVADLCCGTGDIAELWVKDPRVKEIIAIDSCAAMLQQGYTKLEKKYQGPPPKIHMVEADALAIPAEDNSFDAVTIGFGLRNVSDLDLAIEEIYRVLKPGAFFASLDLGHPSLPVIGWLYKKIFLKFIPFLGSIFAKDKAAYQYLIKSLDTWPTQKQLTQGLYKFGFKRAYYKSLLLGTIAIVVAEK